MFETGKSKIDTFIKILRIRFLKTLRFPYLIAFVFIFYKKFFSHLVKIFLNDFWISLEYFLLICCNQRNFLFELFELLFIFGYYFKYLF